MALSVVYVESCTALAGHITCGASIYIVYCRKLRLGWLYVCSVIVLCRIMMKRKEKAKPGAGSKSTMGASRLNVPIRRTNRYQQYYMPSQHTYCGRVWNLIQACDVQSSDKKVYISTPPSPEVEYLLPRQGSNPGPAEPETDMLPSEPVWQASEWSVLPLFLVQFVLQLTKMWDGENWGSQRD